MESERYVILFGVDMEALSNKLPLRRIFKTENCPDIRDNIAGRGKSKAQRPRYRVTFGK